MFDKILSIVKYMYSFQYKTRNSWKFRAFDWYVENFGKICLKFQRLCLQFDLVGLANYIFFSHLNCSII